MKTSVTSETTSNVSFTATWITTSIFSFIGDNVGVGLQLKTSASADSSIWMSVFVWYISSSGCYVG